MSKAKKGTRPDKAKALQAAKHNLEKHEGRWPGTVENQQPGLQYVWFVPSEMNSARVRHLRDQLEKRQWWLADGDEYLPEHSEAEIWCTYQEVGEQEFKKRKAKNDADKAELQGRLRRLRAAAQAGGTDYVSGSG